MLPICPVCSPFAARDSNLCPAAQIRRWRLHDAAWHIRPFTDLVHPDNIAEHSKSAVENLGTTSGAEVRMRDRGVKRLSELLDEA